MAEDFPCPVIRHDQRDRDALRSTTKRIAGKAFHGPLHPRVERQDMHRHGRLRAPGPVGEMRRKRGKRPAHVGDRLSLGCARCLGVDHPCRRHPVEHAIPRRPRGLAVTIRAAPFGRLRLRDEKGGLSRRKARGLLPEPGQRRGTKPFEISAKGRARKIEVEDLVLGQPPFERERHADLAQFAGPASRLAVFEQPGHLHGQGRGARHDPPVAHGLPRRP